MASRGSVHGLPAARQNGTVKGLEKDSCLPCGGQDGESREEPGTTPRRP